MTVVPVRDGAAGARVGSGGLVHVDALDPGLVVEAQSDGGTWGEGGVGFT